MNTFEIISELYKKELADAIEKKLILVAQCEVYRKRIEQLEAELAKLKDNAEE